MSGLRVRVVWFTGGTPPYDTAAAARFVGETRQVLLLGLTYRNDLTGVFRFDDQHVPCAGRAQRREQTQILWQEIHLSSDSPLCARHQEKAELGQPFMSIDVMTEPELWVDRHGDGLYRYALLRLRSPDLAADIVQETFVDALRARDTFAGRSSEWTWLVGILRHKILDHIRKAGRQPMSGRGERAESELAFDQRGEWLVGPAEWSSDPSLQLETVEFWDVIAGCLSRLPQGLADAFTLRELDGLEADEVQSILDISPANLWKRSTARDFSCGDVSNPVGTENGRRSRHHHDQKGISVHDLFPDRLAPSQHAMRRFDSSGLGIARPRPELAGSGRLEIAFDLLLGMPPLFPTTQVHAKRISTAGKAGRSRGILA